MPTFVVARTVGLGEASSSLQMRRSVFNSSFREYIDQVRESESLDLVRIIDPIGN